MDHLYDFRVKYMQRMFGTVMQAKYSLRIDRKTTYSIYNIIDLNEW